MSKTDLGQLLTLLGRAIDAVPGTRRDLEDSLGVGHGTLPRLLDGRLELKVRHLLALAEVLDVPPGEFLALGCPEATARAGYHLADRLAPARRTTRVEAAGAGSARLSPGALAELAPLLRQLIREEMAGVAAKPRKAAP